MFLFINGPNSPYILFTAPGVGYPIGYNQGAIYIFNHSYGFEVNYNPYSKQCFVVSSSEYGVHHRSVRNGTVRSYSMSYANRAGNEFTDHVNPYTPLVNSNIAGTEYQSHQNYYIDTVNSNIDGTEYLAHQNPYTPVEGSTISAAERLSTGYSVPTTTGQVGINRNMMLFTAPSLYAVTVKNDWISEVRTAPSVSGVTSLNYNVVVKTGPSSLSNKENLQLSIQTEPVEPVGPPPPPVTEIYHVGVDSAFEIIDVSNSYARTAYIAPPVVVTPVVETKVMIFPGGIGHMRKNKPPY